MKGTIIGTLGAIALSTTVAAQDNTQKFWDTYLGGFIVSHASYYRDDKDKVHEYSKCEIAQNTVKLVMSFNGYKFKDGREVRVFFRKDRFPDLMGCIEDFIAEKYPDFHLKGIREDLYQLSKKPTE